MRISAKDYIPQLAFRFSITLGTLPGIEFYGKSVQLPQASNNVIELAHRNHKYKVKGQTTWNDISLTLYNYEGGADTLSELYNWWNAHHQSAQGSDNPHSVYVQDVIIKLHDAADAPSKQVKLVDAFISSIDLGSLDFDSEDIHTITLELAYDYADWG